MVPKLENTIANFTLIELYNGNLHSVKVMDILKEKEEEHVSLCLTLILSFGVNLTHFNV